VFEVASAFWTSVVLFLGAGLVILLIVIYNRLVAQRQNVKQGVADIDAQLRQRHVHFHYRRSGASGAEA
jgi:LemA protein